MVTLSIFSPIWGVKIFYSQVVPGTTEKARELAEVSLVAVKIDKEVGIAASTYKLTLNVKFEK